MPFFVAEIADPFFVMHSEHESLEAARHDAEAREPGHYLIVKTVGEVQTDEVTLRRVSYETHDKRKRAEKKEAKAKLKKE